MKYFQYQDVVPYTFGNTVIDITDITERAKIVERLGQYTSVMYDYVIGEEQRPDAVALLVYGDVKYTWLVLLLNNIVSLYDWPLTNTEFTDYIISKYGSIDAAKAGMPIYYTTEGDRVDAVTYGTLPSARRGKVLTPYEQEEVDNDAKRRIRVVSSRFLSSIEQSLKTLYR